MLAQGRVVLVQGWVVLAQGRVVLVQERGILPFNGEKVIKLTFLR